MSSSGFSCRNAPGGTKSRDRNDPKSKLASPDHTTDLSALSRLYRSHFLQENTILLNISEYDVFQDLQHLHTIAPLQTQNLRIFAIFRKFLKFSVNSPNFPDTITCDCCLFANICYFSPRFSENFDEIAKHLWTIAGGRCTSRK